MKLIKIILSLIFSYAISTTVNAQNDTVQIKTSAICDQCKERLENDLSFEKGVKSSHVNVKTQVITVIYNSQKTNSQKIREEITKIGYDADTLKADLKSYNKLPDCCKHDSKQH